MKYSDVIAAWNAQSDKYYQWSVLREEEKIKFAIAMTEIKYRNITSNIEMLNAMMAAIESMERESSDMYDLRILRILRDMVNRCGYTQD